MDYSTALLRSPLHGWHVEHRAKLTLYSRWQVPTVYTGLEHEIDAARSSLALGDLSSFVRLELRGAGVPGAAWALASGSPALQPLGVGAFVGGELSLACRLTDDHLLLLLSTAHAEGVIQYLTALANGQELILTDVTSTLAEFVLLGPLCWDALRRLSALDLIQELPAGSCLQTNVAGVHVALVRSPELPILAIRIVAGWDVAEYLWDRLVEIGQEFELLPIGLDSLKTLLPIGYP